MRSIRLLLVVLIMALASLACLTTASPTPTGNVLFFDDFSNTSKAWDQVTEDTRTTGYLNNAYNIVINDTNSDAWANPKDVSLTDVSVEVDAAKNSGPDDNDFGVICRYTDLDKFYYALISSDGYYAIMKMTSDGGNPLGEDNMLENDKINKGAATNHIRFDCVGSTLTLYVNGNLLAQKTDSDYTSGNIGLIAGTFDTAGTDILFDNFVVYKP